MGAKIWWQWLINPYKPWATLWKAKYANQQSQEELIILIPTNRGSLIWNTAKEHYQLIQEHSFLEVRNGHTTRFWTDAWNQMPNICSTLNISTDKLEEGTQQAKIKDFWTQAQDKEYRTWKTGIQALTNEGNYLTMELEGELSKRKIRWNESKDILRWGYQPKGAYTTLEAHKIMCKDSDPQEPIWHNIWNSGSWPKICFFLWLVGQRRILTWDKIKKRSFHGPSICYNCRNHEENLHHLLDSCPLANQIWEKVSFKCQRRSRLGENITLSLSHWPQNPYKSEILNQLWKLIPGIVLWSIWKERNKCIFKNKQSNIESIWNLICNNLQENLNLKTWKEEDWPMLDNERNIINKWKLQINKDSQSLNQSEASGKGKSAWIPPSKPSFKLNFDGASKGNPGQAGYGGIIRNHEGTPLILYYGNIGWDTNNFAELEGLRRGLQLAGEFNYYPLEMEGDSQILITMATKILNGTQVRNIATSWRLEARLENIASELQRNRAITFMHTRREGNKVADFMSNVGVETQHSFLTGAMNTILTNEKAQECSLLV